MSQQLSGDLAERFVLEYRKDLNATQAYFRCRDPKARPIKESTAATEGWRLLRKPEVQARLADLTRQATDRLKIDAETVLRELAICGFSSVEDYVKDDLGNFALSETAHALAGRAVASVKHKTTTRTFGEGEVTEHQVEYRLWPKVEALKALAQHLGLIGKEEAPPAGITLTVRWVQE